MEIVVVGRRVTVIEIELGAGEEKAELCEVSDVTGNSLKTIPLRFDKLVEVAATEFEYADHSTIKLFVDGLDTGKFLMPRDFTTYAKIIIDKERKIKGIKARWTDWDRIKGLGIFGRRTYGGDREQFIICD